MRKNAVIKLLLLLAGLLCVIFCMKTLGDYGRYTTTLNSAPFSVFILVNAVVFLFPAIVLAIIALVLRRR